MTIAMVDGEGVSFRQRAGRWWPVVVLAPSLLASFVYVVVFTLWTLYISLSNSGLLPSYGFVGLENYASLWANRRWNIAYNNLFFFSAFYILGSMAVGLLLAILIDQRVKGEALWRTIFLYPLAVSFIVTGTVWSWLYNPADGVQMLVRSLGWESFSFALASDRNTAIYAVIITGIWQSSGFAMALFLAGLRSVDPDLVKAAQIDGASAFRTYRKVILPTIAPIFLAVAVVQIQFAIKTFDLVAALTRGGPGVSTTFPAIYVYDLMFQRGQIGEGAAAAMMMLAALAVVLVPYSFFVVWRRRRESRHG
ncbi:carbohydrate ABC transporter permease [Prosthecomicrobium pneumaticum]|uniref:Glucose/mannose transport system permease protein n=1 Tax=Prosthecomicrobium pneumaticum TaxID=81895 RepID=A0A7W9FLI9_9HYPH|nr:sugar ABC transporter permease [Prosthecomicrobium pneumaticum]MBB5752877.1 glucose/mannose transport system permease protein [Prosthecomicrobium pneumaticum]